MVEEQRHLAAAAAAVEVAAAAAGFEIDRLCKAMKQVNWYWGISGLMSVAGICRFEHMWRLKSHYIIAPLWHTD